MLPLKRLTSVVCLLLVAMATGCNSGERPQRNSSGDSDVLPIESLLYGGTQRNEKARQASEKTLECMHSRGWTQFAGHVSIVTELPSPVELAKADAELAYGITAPDPPAPYDPDAKWVANLTAAQSQEFVADLWSVSASDLGCMYVGQLDAFGNMAIASSELTTILDEVQAMVDASPEQAALDAKWAECIGEAGYAYAAPSEILDDLSSQLNALPMTAQGRPDMKSDGLLNLRKLEHRLYDADRSCRDVTEYDASAFRIRSVIERAVLDRHPSLLEYVGSTDT